MWAHGDRLVWYFSRRDQRTWRQLRVILNGLPADSHFIAAQRNDPRVAEAVVKRATDSNRKWTPPATEWSLDRELLAAVFDRLGELITATINQNAKQPTQPPDRYPRPVTEIDRAMARIESAIEDELAGLITGAHETWEAEHPNN